MKYKKKKKKLGTIHRKLDDLWKTSVYRKYEYKCAYCGKKTNLNAHHIFSRSNLSTRWDLENAVLLCSGHHTLNSNFSAHKTPTEFTRWLEKTRGKKFLDDLEQRAHSIFQKGSEELIQEKLSKS